MNCSYCETELRIVERSENSIIKLEPYCDSCNDSFGQYWFHEYPKNVDETPVYLYKKQKLFSFDKKLRKLNDD